MIDLEVVLITGANQGIGFHIALQLGKLAGYHVVLGVRSVNKGEEAVKRLRALGATSQLSYVILDVDSDESIGNALGRIKSKHGRLDVLVNNAGTFLDGSDQNRPIREVFSATYATNVFGVASLIEAAMPMLQRAPFPRIVNVSSGLGSLTIMSNWDSVWATARNPAYNSSKTAVNALTVHYAWILAQKNPASRVISVDPGYNATNMNGYTGTQEPAVGAAGIVRVILAPVDDAEIKTSQLRDQLGFRQSW